MYKKKQAGISLIEVIISLALLGGLIVLYAAAFNVTAYTRRMKYENIAYHVASKKMEELRGTPFASLPPSNTFTDSLFSVLPSASGNFTINNYSTYTGMKEIVVTVNWNDGRARNIEIRSVAGSGGINP